MAASVVVVVVGGGGPAAVVLLAAGGGGGGGVPFDVRPRDLEGLRQRENGPLVLADLEAEGRAVDHFLGARVDEFGRRERGFHGCLFAFAFAFPFALYI